MPEARYRKPDTGYQSPEVSDAWCPRRARAGQKWGQAAPYSPIAGWLRLLSGGT